MTSSSARRRQATKDKAAAVRAAQERRERRRRTLVVAVTAVVVLGLVLVVGLVVRQAAGSPDADVAVPSGVTGGGITVGEASAPVALTTYLDYQCPACARFEATNADLLAGLRESGDVAVQYRPIAILDRMSRGTQYSSRAAGAAVCVADVAPDAFVAFNDALFADQPAEGTAGLDDDRLTALATEAGAPASVGDCIAEERFVPWVEQATAAARDDESVVPGGVSATPTVILSGPGLAEPQQVDAATWQSPDALQAAIEQAAG